MQTVNEGFLKERMLWNLRKGRTESSSFVVFAEDVSTEQEIQEIERHHQCGSLVARFDVDEGAMLLVGTKKMLEIVGQSIQEIRLADIADSEIVNANRFPAANCDRLAISDRDGRTVVVRTRPGSDLNSLASLILMLVRMNKGAKA